MRSFTPCLPTVTLLEHRLADLAPDLRVLSRSFFFTVPTVITVIFRRSGKPDVLDGTGGFDVEHD